MELSRGKRIILGITLIAVVVLSFLGGYLLARVKPSSYISNNSKNEVINILDEYYYADYDKDLFEKESLKKGVASLNDPYTYLYTLDTITNGSFFGYGMGATEKPLGLKIIKVYDNSPADKLGVEEEDYLIGVDDLRIGDKTASEISDYLKSADKEVTMYFLRNMKEYSVKMQKETVTVNQVTSKLIDTIGYIKIENFDTGSSKAFSNALKELESKNITGLVIDVRNNPGGLASEVSNILRNFLTGSDAFLYLKAEKQKNPEIYRATNATKKSYDIKVLINENSASASEVFALAMNKVEGYDLIGTNTFGKNVFQNDFKLESMKDTYLHVTLGHWYGPNEEMIDENGITPTIELVDDKYIAFPINDETYSIDMADDEIKNISLMLKELGYDVRVDGYFDNNIKTILESDFESSILDYNTKKKIFDKYYAYRNDEANDLVLSKAIDELK